MSQETSYRILGTVICIRTRVQFIIVPVLIEPKVTIMEKAKAQSQLQIVSQVMTRLGQLPVLKVDIDRKFLVDFEKIFDQAFKVADNAFSRLELLAKAGWTFPPGNMPFPDFQELVMRDDLTVEATDRWFVDYYAAEESEFDALTKTLLTSHELSTWKLLLEQCMGAYKREEYAICVPSLLSVLEGSMAVPWDIKFQTKAERDKFFQRKIDHARPKTNRYRWRSMHVFVDEVFTSASSNRKDPILKRDLILHGKSDPADWGKADCLRLFQAIASVLELYKRA